MLNSKSVVRSETTCEDLVIVFNPPFYDVENMSTFGAGESSSSFFDVKLDVIIE